MSANDSEHAKRSLRRRANKQASEGPNGSTAGGRAHEVSAEVSTEASDERAVVLPEDRREEVWALHLRGQSQRQIARSLTLDRKTVARLINECYREFGAERRARLRRKLDAAVAKMQAIQRQAWEDHDTDDARERAIIEAAQPGSRYQSQRSQYLRLALDTEKEIARLEGLYADDVSDLTAVLFSVERVIAGVAVKRSTQQPTTERAEASGATRSDEGVSEG